MIGAYIIILAHTPGEDWSFGPYASYRLAQEALVGKEHDEDGNTICEIEYQIVQLLPAENIETG